MSDFIDDAIPEHGDFVPAVLAGKLAAQLREQQPEVLETWLHDHAERFLTAEIRDRLNSQRATSLRRAKARAFADAAEAADAGDDEPLSHFAVVYRIDDENTRRRVADMTGADHQFVAGSYEASGKYDRMLCAFHRAVAKKVKTRTTAEVMSEEQYHDLFRSISGRAA